MDGYALRQVVAHKHSQIVHEVHAFCIRPSGKLAGLIIKLGRMEDRKTATVLKAAQATAEQLPLARRPEEGRHDHSRRRPVRVSFVKVGGIEH